MLCKIPRYTTHGLSPQAFKESTWADQGLGTHPSSLAGFADSWEQKAAKDGWSLTSTPAKWKPVWLYQGKWPGSDHRPCSEWVLWSGSCGGMKIHEKKSKGFSSLFTTSVKLPGLMSHPSGFLSLLFWCSQSSHPLNAYLPAQCTLTAHLFVVAHTGQKKKNPQLVERCFNWILWKQIFRMTVLERWGLHILKKIEGQINRPST